MNKIYISKVDRRTTLKWLASSAALLVASPYSLAAKSSQQSDNILPTWPRIFTQEQLQLTATLADLILPGTDTAPTPSQLGIPEFIDEWVSAPFPAQRKDHTLIVEGLSWLNQEAQQRGGKNFDAIGTLQQLRLVDSIAVAEGQEDSSSKNAFFQRFRYLVIGAYYTTPEGVKDIGYVGNVPLAEYPPISEQEKIIMDKELAKLGLNEKTGEPIQ